MGQAPGLSNRTIGEQGGTEEVTLTVNQMPSHTHATVLSSGAGSESSPIGNFLAASPNVRLYRPGQWGVRTLEGAVSILLETDLTLRSASKAPGMALMERALLQDTDRVRFAEEAGYDLAPGASTAEAVRHGIALAQAGALALALDRAGPAPPRLFFCGGWGRTLMGLLDRGGEYLPDLVVEGLEILAAGAD